MKWIKRPQLPEGYREDTILVKRLDGSRMLLAYNGQQSNSRWLALVDEWLDETQSIPLTNEEDELYWKERCEAAENCICDLNIESLKKFDVYQKWQAIKGKAIIHH